MFTGINSIFFLSSNLQASLPFLEVLFAAGFIISRPIQGGPNRLTNKISLGPHKILLNIFLSTWGYLIKNETYIGVHREAVVDACRQDKKITLANSNSDPSVLVISNVKIA